MGAVCAGLLERVANAEVFDKRQAGPTVRNLFGAYRNPDYWAVYRRFRSIDDGNGFMSYEELLQCISLAEYQSLFLWETFSQQNELLNAREVMTVICVFSAATLDEKGKFLQALFDDSATGLNTASEIVNAMHMVLHVLMKCTGVNIKVKEVRDQFKSVVPDLLPAWEDALARSQGKSEVAFTSGRFIGQLEMEQLLPSLAATYETLPIAGPPPPGASQPPPPDWATPSSLEKGQAKVPEKKEKAAAGGASAKALSKAELEHLAWIANMDDEEAGEEGKENMQGNARKAKFGSSGSGQEKAVDAPAKGWMVIYEHDFAKIAKNLAAFRHLFMKSVATALGIPMGCVEVLNITRGSVVIEFLLHPSGRDNDSRDGSMLKDALALQLASPHSSLRKGSFKDYAVSAELVERPANKSLGTSLTAAGQSQQLHPHKGINKEVQTDLPEQDDQMKAVLEDLEASENEARRWQKKNEELEAERDKALKELAELKEKHGA